MKCTKDGCELPATRLHTWAIPDVRIGEKDVALCDTHGSSLVEYLKGMGFFGECHYAYRNTPTTPYQQMLSPSVVPPSPCDVPPPTLPPRSDSP